MVQGAKLPVKQWVLVKDRIPTVYYIGEVKKPPLHPITRFDRSKSQYTGFPNKDTRYPTSYETKSSKPYGGPYIYNRDRLLFLCFF